MTTKSPFPWFGGKAHMRNKLLPLIPEHKIYVEPFGGAASLLLSKEPSSVEVYNDLDSGLVNFFRVLRDRRKFNRLQFLAYLTPYSREEFEWAAATWAECNNPVDRAHRWFTVARAAFGGRFGNSWGFTVTASCRGMAAAVSRYLGSVDGLPSIHLRLMRVQIEHRDALFIINTYDTKETFFYLDPPYVPSTRRGGEYQHELTEDDHRKLVNRLLRVKGKVMLSGYRNPIYAKLEKKGWKRIDWPVVCSAAGSTRLTRIQGPGSATAMQSRVESVWLNYKPPKKAA